MKHRRVPILFLLPVVLVAGCSGPGSVAPLGHTKVLEIGPLKIDRIYRSMDGPHDRMSVPTDGMDWITGFKTEVVDAGSGQKMGDEFFCHSQIQINNSVRLMVTATGMAELQFPKGFGMPLTEILKSVPQQSRGVSLLGMVLNNHDQAMNRETRVRATIDYLTASEAQEVGLKKLYKVELPITMEPAAGESGDDGSSDHCMTIAGVKTHWLVPPGRHVFKKVFSGIIPVDATVHYASVHLHNYGVSMRIRDLTDGREMWQTKVVYEPARVQITEIPSYSSETGFPIYAKHVYEVEALYDNTTNDPVDAMAGIYLFCRPHVDVKFQYRTASNG